MTPRGGRSVFRWVHLVFCAALLPAAARLEGDEDGREEDRAPARVGCTTLLAINVGSDTPRMTASGTVFSEDR